MSKNRINNFNQKKFKKVFFYFDGKKLSGFEGESLASALIANGIKLVGRSFKYHRPRGIMALGSEEPNALVRINKENKTEPNLQATQVEIYNGLIAESQNRWPSLKFDFGSILSVFSRLFPAGFYYKTFMWPGNMWKTYEYFIRRISGLGKVSNYQKDPDKYEHINFHTDLLIVGAGLSGLVASLLAAQTGLKILLVDENSFIGGSLLCEDDIKINSYKGKEWAEKTAQSLMKMPNVTVLNRSTVFGYHDHNYITILQKNIDYTRTEFLKSPRQRLWKVRAKKVILAQGLIERPLTLSGNDKPGVMMSSAVRGYINKYNVLPGNEVVICTNNDDAYRTALSLNHAGATVKYVVDLRPENNRKIVKLVKDSGIKILFKHAVVSVNGFQEVKNIEIAPISDDGNEIIKKPIKVNVNLLALSGGWTPSVHLFSQSGGKLFWDSKSFCFKPSVHFQEEITVGGSDGNFDYESSVIETIDKTKLILKQLGKKNLKNIILKVKAPKLSTEQGTVFFVPNWNSKKSFNKAFVDFQNDVVASDILLASDEGYNSIEHLKRYTTLGMGTDQGKTSNIAGIGILSKKLSKGIKDIGTTTFRMPYTPVTFGAIGGVDIKSLFDPVRLTKIDPWHRKNEARYEHVGQWMRAWYYPRENESMQVAVNREVYNTRKNVGVLDASTLGKIDIKGQDSRKFLNMLYTNDWSSISKGQCKYGLMLKEDGMVFDDGVTSCINENHFHMSTTSGGASNVMSWMEEWLQTEWPHMDVFLTSVTEQWTVISLSGPKSKEVLNSAGCDINLSNENFPFMTFKEGSIDNVPVRIFRISFTGELSYEINVPSRYGLHLWQQIIKNGEQFNLMPYGTEAMHVLRAEKGFIIVGQETDGSVNPLDLGMNWIVSKKKNDFIGKTSLSITSLNNNRKQLVGIHTNDPNKVLPEGAHAVEQVGKPPVKMLGHVTSSYFSPNCNRSIALALIKNGHSKIGQTVHFPLLNDEVVSAKVVKPLFFDPNGDRINGI